MDWLQSLDVEMFRFVNTKLANPFFDWLMPFVSGNVFFFPLLLLVGFLLVCKGGARGRLCFLMLALVIPLGDSFVCNTIKKAVGRPRPFLTLPDVRRPGASPGHGDRAHDATASDDPHPPIPAGYAGSPSMP